MDPLFTARFDQGATWNTMWPTDQAGPDGYAPRRRSDADCPGARRTTRTARPVRG